MNNLLLKNSGRTVSFKVFGSDKGIPTLFINGAGMDGSLTFDEEALIEFDIKVYSIDRAGFGDSDSVKEKSFEQFNSDIKSLLSFLEIKKINCIAFSQGAVFAYSLCENKLINKCAIVAGQDDFNFKRTFIKLPNDIKEFITSVKTNF